MESLTSFEKYKKIFSDYAARYDKSDGRVALKIVHTQAVVEIMGELCSRLSLPEHLRFLALLCAQFHDIGRFEQLKRYDTFLDHLSTDHARLSCEVLKELGILEELSESDREMVFTAIENHNKYAIEDWIVKAASDEVNCETDCDAGRAGGHSLPSVPQERLILCKLIRDADKCDIFRVFATDDMVDVIGVPDSQVAADRISPQVLEATKNHRCIDKRLRETYLDFWVSFLGFFFDMNYKESAAIARAQGYYRMPFDRTEFTNPETKKQVEEVLAIVEDYLDTLIKGDGAPIRASVPVPGSLVRFFADHSKVALAFSGGVDSAYLLWAAMACGADVRAYYVKTPFQPEFEFEDAKRLARELGADMKVLSFDVLALDAVRANPADRCYYCKNAIFSNILASAASDGFSVIIDGTNASDDASDRPGMRALKEMQVLSPLRLSGLTKAQIREESKKAGLFTWNKPAYACLATRIPAGTAITADLLEKIERSESALMELGFSDFRVRVMPAAVSAEIPAAFIAKLQLPESQLLKLLERRKSVLEILKKEFEGVVLDLEGRP